MLKPSCLLQRKLWNKIKLVSGLLPMLDQEQAEELHSQLNVRVRLCVGMKAFLCPLHGMARSLVE